MMDRLLELCQPKHAGRPGRGRYSGKGADLFSVQQISRGSCGLKDLPGLKCSVTREHAQIQSAFY